MKNYEDYSLVPILQELEHFFEVFNDHFFEGVLQPAVINASTTGRKNAYGWCTAWKAWTTNNKDDIHTANPTPEEIRILTEQDGYYEINICAEYLSRPFPQICATLIHEMVHLFCLQFDIKDTSRNGVYHNNKFRENAERFGLIVSKDSRAGWHITELNLEALKFVESLNHDAFDLHRRNMKNTVETPKKPGMRKYVCPVCNCIIRATREVEVRCMRCEVPFDYIVPEDEKQVEVGLDPEVADELTEDPIPEVIEPIEKVDDEEPIEEVIETAEESIEESVIEETVEEAVEEVKQIIREVS